MNFAGSHVTSPLNLLLAQPAIQYALSSFRLFRADLMVRAVITSTMGDFGLVIAGTLPQDSEAAFRGLHNTAPKFSVATVQCDPVLLDVATNESASFKLPYCQESDFWSIDSWAVEAPIDDWIVPFYCSALGSVAVAGGRGVQIDVYANFVNPKASMLREQRGAFQSAHAVFEEILSSAPVQRNINKATDFAFSYAAERVGDLYQKVTGDDNFNPFDGFGEQEQSEQNSQTRFEPLGALSSPVGIPSNCCLLGDNQNYGRVYLPSFRTPSTVSDFICMPHYMGSYSITAGAPVYIKSHDLLSDPSSYAAQFFKAFRFWRGGFRVLVRVVSTPMVSFRLQTTSAPVNDLQPLVLPFGDVSSRQITVQGTVDLEFTLPYLYKDYMAPTDIVSPLTNLEIALVGTLPDFNGAVYVPKLVVFMACDSDMSFCGLQSPTPHQATFQSLRQLLPPSGTKPCLKNYTLAEMLTRYSTLTDNQTAVSPFNGYMPHQPASSAVDLWLFVTRLFKYWTGSVLIKAVMAGDPINGIAQVGLSNNRANQNYFLNTGDSSVGTVQAVWPTMDLCVPFLNSTPFATVGSTSPVGLCFTENTGVTAIKVRAGPSFGLGVAVPVVVLPEPVGQFQSVGGCFATGSASLQPLQVYSFGDVEAGEEINFSLSYAKQPSSASTVTGYVALYMTGSSSTTNVAIPALPSTGTTPVSFDNLSGAYYKIVGLPIWTRSGGEAVWFGLAGKFSMPVAIAGANVVARYCSTASAVDIIVSLGVSRAGVSPVKISGTVSDLQVLVVNDVTSPLPVQVEGGITGTHVLVSGYPSATDPVWTSNYH